MKQVHLTWADLVRQAPALGTLAQEAIRQRRLHPNPEARYPVFKRELARLVGWSSPNPCPRTREAYELACRHLYDLLTSPMPYQPPKVA